MMPSRETCSRAILWDWANRTRRKTRASWAVPEGTALCLACSVEKKEVVPMANRKTLSLMAVLTLLCVSFAGCGPAMAQGVTVTDMKGRTVSLSEPATRVVALTASDCEILYALGAGETLVGRGEYCDYPAAVLDVPAVQSGMETNLEQIIALKPQVVLMDTMAQSEEQVNQLEDAGIRVVVSEATDIQGVYDAIAMIGALMGRAAEADTLIANMQASFATLTDAAVGSGKSVYFEVSPLQYGLWTAGKGTFMDEIATMLGLVNCFADVDGWAEVSQEQVLERNPDYIVTSAMYYGDGPTPKEEILSRDGWQSITAVQNGAVLDMPNYELTRPGPRLVDGATLLNDFVKDSTSK
jgi:iron complex transport system substrate-binding protein